MKYSFCCALINWVNKEFMNKFTAFIVVVYVFTIHKKNNSNTYTHIELSQTVRVKIPYS